MLGYTWVRLHAALNDLPTALLLMAVLFDFLGAVNQRESLKAAGFWCLIAGVLGGGVAALSGLLASHEARHSEATHAVMETHETFAFVMLGMFALLAVWRLLRRGMVGKQEQTIFTTAGIIAVGLMVFTARLGGNLVFEHATGIDGHVLQQEIEDRQGGHMHDEADHDHAVPVSPRPDSLRAAPGSDSAHPR